jgi:hypothetical protein
MLLSFFFGVYFVAVLVALPVCPLSSLASVAQPPGQDVVILSGLSACAIDVKHMGLSNLISDAKFMKDEIVKHVCPKMKVVHRNVEILNLEGAIGTFICFIIIIIIIIRIFF